MQGNNQQFHINNKRHSIKQSAIILSTHVVQNNLSTIDHHPKKHLAASTFIDLNQYKSQKLTASRSLKHEYDSGGYTQQIQRQKSIRHDQFKLKTHQENDQQSNQHINNNYIRLKVQQMAFKFKTKIGTLLKQISIPAIDLNKYASLTKIDDILHFLSQKIKQKLSTIQVNESNSLRLRDREKQIVSELSDVVEGLRKKLDQKQINQKQQKAKLKDNHNEIKQLYDKINNKQRQISLKTTEIYQTKIIIQENTKYITSLQSKITALEKQYQFLKSTAENGHKNIYNHCAKLEQRQKQFQQQIIELKQNIAMLQQKQTKLLSFNKSISEQVQRWRQRFQSQRQMSKQQKQAWRYQGEKFSGQGEGVSHFESRQKPLLIFGKQDNKSHRSYNLQEANQLLTIISIHEQEIKDLKNQIMALKVYKKQYQVLMDQKNVKRQDENMKNQENNQIITQQTKIELQANYNKKMEKMSGQWKKKLIQIVDSYQIEENKKKVKIDEIQKERRELQKKVFLLANEKYNLQCKMIQREDEIYRLNKQIQNLIKSKQINRKESLRDQQIPKNQTQTVKTLDNRQSEFGGTKEGIVNGIEQLQEGS